MAGYEIKESGVQDIMGCISSMEIAKMFKWPHIKVFNMITKFITTEATDKEKTEFCFAKRMYKKNQTHKICYLSERGCTLYLDKICSAEHRKSKWFAEGSEKLEREIEARFKKEPIQTRSFLMNGRSRTECVEIKEIFDLFITGPGLEKREIAELTQSYQEFYEVLKKAQLQAKESNLIEEAVYRVAIEAEMQGFIYGFKTLDVLMNKPALAHEGTGGAEAICMQTRRCGNVV